MVNVIGSGPRYGTLVYFLQQFFILGGMVVLAIFTAVWAIFTKNYGTFLLTLLFSIVFLVLLLAFYLDRKEHLKQKKRPKRSKPTRPHEQLKVGSVSKTLAPIPSKTPAMTPRVTEPKVPASTDEEIIE